MLAVVSKLKQNDEKLYSCRALVGFSLVDFEITI